MLWVYSELLAARWFGAVDSMLLAFTVAMQTRPIDGTILDG